MSEFAAAGLSVVQLAKLAAVVANKIHFLLLHLFVFSEIRNIEKHEIGEFDINF